MTSVLRVKNLSFPWQTQDPFLFCVFHKDDYPEGNEDMTPKASLAGRNLGNDFGNPSGWSMYHGKSVPGFPAHPHRGFETVTAVQKGIIDHSDSLGAAGRFGNGDVQWMTAGKGVQHSEMFPMLNQDKENHTDFFQIWLNLPAKNKFVEPHFSMLWNKSIPVVIEGAASVRLIAGEYKGEQAPPPAPNSWAADKANNVQIWTINIDANGSFTIPAVDGTVNRSLYFFEGDEINIEGKKYGINKALELDGSQSTLIENGSKSGRFLMLQGKPIGEPVAQYGPFVMNSQQEIMAAMDDYRKTEFGGWPWDTIDHVHPREKGKFALYPDGKLETP
ncbi:pirin family protein [Portibacter lacus]|uniref:Pirin n=1 Tax=Portibacter lacus TaxID=1099794 RepID=A0AA37WEI0_9BACT|nr:pirin family protein [Portibacter lacus]GLR16095.1 hypothetical protein GCM10007940_07100 [Portibacter lacus]